MNFQKVQPSSSCIAEINPHHKTTPVGISILQLSHPSSLRYIKHFPHTNIQKLSTSYLNHNHTSHQSPISASTVKFQDTRDEYPSKPQLAVGRNLPHPLPPRTQPQTTSNPYPPPQQKNPPRNIILSRGGTMTAATYSLTLLMQYHRR